MNSEEEIVKSLKESSEEMKALIKGAESAGLGDDMLSGVDKYMATLDKLIDIFSEEKE